MPSFEEQKNSFDPNDAFNISEFISLVLRNKKSIQFFTFGGTLLFGMYAFFASKTWVGEFQVVIDNSETSSRPKIKGLAELQQFIPKTDLKTEVAILNSPFILRDVYEYVKKEKKSKGLNIDKLSFKDWKTLYVGAKLSRSTNVLDITYKDKDKKLILNTLTKISEAYQKYSNFKRTSNLKSTISYLEDQIRIYEDLSLKSFAKAQSYAIDNNISRSFNPEQSSNLYRIDVENIGLEFFNILKKRESQLETVKNIKNNNLDSIYYFALGIPESAEGTIVKKINDLNILLADAELNYKKDDEYLINIKNRKKGYLLVLKDQIIGVLKNQINTAKANLMASKRPNEVLINYKKLLVISDRDKSTLLNLGDALRYYSLELAKNKSPWQLITEPNVLDKAVSPRKKRILPLGLLIGFFAGLINAFVREKRNRLIYTRKKLESISNLSILAEFNIEQKKDWEELIDLLIIKAGLNQEDKLGIIKVGDFQLSYLEDFIDIFKSKIKKGNLIFSEDSRDILVCSKIILLTSLGLTKVDYVKEIKNKILLQDKKVLGYLLVKGIN